MIKALIFIMKYKILKDPINLSYCTKEFFKLSKKTQRKVIHNKKRSLFSVRRNKITYKLWRSQYEQGY